MLSGLLQVLLKKALKLRGRAALTILFGDTVTKTDRHQTLVAIKVREIEQTLRVTDLE